jgi:hypothetical protein
MLARLRPALGLAGGLVLVLLAGCGASGSASTAGALAAKARFVADAQSVCRTLKAQEQPLKARQESLKGQPTAVADKAFVSVARQVAALSRAADAKLQALPRPTADAHAIAGLLTSFSQEIADVTNVANAVAENQPAVGESADAALRKSIAQNSALADAYGLNACFGSE